jgi:sugar/nucleoside kinase (ribokinase family)
MKVLGIGNALVDILVQLDNESLLQKLNLPKGSMQLIQASDIQNITSEIEKLPAVMVSGGSAANTIHGLASLGISCGYIGKVGVDELGDFYAKDFNDAGVLTSLLNSQTVTGRAYTFITPDSERTFATYLGAAIELTADNMDLEIFKNYDLLHIEGYLVQNTTLIETALKIAKSAGMKTSLDLASFNVVEASIEFLSRIIPEYVDIVFANEEEAKAYTGKNPSSALSEIADQCDIAVVKIGKEGSLIQARDNKFEVGIIPVTAIDTTGAGDQYAAGFLSGYLKNMSLDKCGKIGALLAGKVIENYGARVPSTLWPEITKEVELILSE